MLFGRSLLFDSDVVVHNVRTAQSGNNSPKSGVFRTSSRWFDLKLGLNEYSLFFSSNNCRLSLVGCCSEISRGCFHFSFGCFCCSNLLLKCWLLLSFFFSADTDSNSMIPESDNNEDDQPGHLNGNNRAFRDNENNNENTNHSVTMDEDGLVIPRKPINPTKESIEYRALHKELKFCQKSYVFISIFLYSLSLSLSTFRNNNGLVHFSTQAKYASSSTKTLEFVLSITEKTRFSLFTLLWNLE